MAALGLLQSILGVRRGSGWLPRQLVTETALDLLHVVVMIFAMLLLAMHRLHNSWTRMVTLMDIMIART